MAKKSKAPKGQKGAKKRSQKWSRANIANFVLGGIVALSMLLGSVFMFGGVTPQNNNQSQPTPIVTSTPMPASIQGVTSTSIPAATTPTPAATQTP